MRLSEALKLVATFCTVIFAGAALYVSLVEHPARMSLGTAAALAQWAPSYKRGAFLQAPLAILASLAGFAVWLLEGGVVWLASALLVGAAVVFTLIVILPTNHALLTPARDPASSETRLLLRRWGRLHVVRTLLGLTATALLLWRVGGS